MTQQGHKSTFPHAIQSPPSGVPMTEATQSRMYLKRIPLFERNAVKAQSNFQWTKLELHGCPSYDF